MGRETKSFKSADIGRALKAAQSAGFEVDLIEIRPDGVLQISRAKERPVEVASDPFEAWKAKRDAR